MKLLTALSLWLALALTGTLVAAKQSVHVHGEARANVIINGQTVTVELRIPALSVVGFEHSPTSKEEHQRIEKAIQTLQLPHLFSFHKDSSWFRSPQHIHASILKNKVEIIDDHGDDDHDHESHHEENHDSHGEFLVQLHYELEKNLEIGVLSTELFSRVPDLHVLHITVISDDQQIQYELDHSRPKMRLKGD